MTKLNKIARDERKFLLAMFPNVALFSFDWFGVTVGVERTGEVMGNFAVAIAADDESKFRRKVGEFEVLKRFDRACTLPVYLGEKTEEWDVVAGATTGMDLALSRAAEEIAAAVSVGR